MFTAKVEDEHYWRIETKDVYTGKGWELSKEEEKVPFKGNENLLPQYDSSVAGEVRKAEVTYSQPSVHLMHVPQLLSLTLKMAFKPMLHRQMKNYILIKMINLLLFNRMS